MSVPAHITRSSRKNPQIITDRSEIPDGVRLIPVLFTFVAAGGISNMIDRLVLGYVTDMVEITLFRFAVFNAADAALTVGMILLGISILFRPQEWERAHEQ